MFSILNHAGSKEPPRDLQMWPKYSLRTSGWQNTYKFLANCSRSNFI
ncbi:unnamed protein product [Moneuplotes crassus]|uniref:Uncharacterized protein n=1 Tax=Euplotes crassus TaxID=5936 RepID=A0AAD1XV13_EUPCR|nr:unnamed protein product [Moneuplotes crassus]